MSKRIHILQTQETPINRRWSVLKTKGLLTLLFATTMLIGCQFAPKSVPKSWSWSEEEKPVVPDRILAIWTDTVLRQPNQPGVRGFGGRVFFYEKEKNDPVEVDGKLIVFVFDADDQDPENQKPLRKYVIEADDFSKHMSKTSIGPAYSVWLPWGDVKGPTMKLSIIARYEGRKGGTTLSDPTMKLLPGVEGGSRKTTNSPSDKATVDSRNSSGVGNLQRASYEQPAKSDSAKSGSAKSGSGDSTENSSLQRLTEPTKMQEPARAPQTIELPPSFQRHFQSSELPLSNRSPAPQVPEITRSQVTTEVIDSRSQKLGTFKKAYSGSSQTPQSIRRSPTSRLESLRSGKTISKKSDEHAMFPEDSSGDKSVADGLKSQDDSGR